MPNINDLIARITSNGIIQDIVYCLNDELPIEVFAPPGGTAMVVPSDPILPSYVKNGVILPLPDRPFLAAQWDLDQEIWYDPRPLEEIQAEAEAFVRAFRDAVNAKRSRVITAGTEITLTGYGQVALQGRPEDQTSLQGLAFGAQLRLGMGDATTLMSFLDRNNVLHQLTPMQMLELWQKGAGFVSAIYARSWAIKEMNPETTDIEDPALWNIGA